MVSRRRLAARRVKRWAKGALLVLVISFMTLELTSMAAIEVGLIAAEKPNYLMPGLRPFWINSNPHFGVWHEPNTEYVHTKSCFSVTYRTNSYGARDRMRQSYGAASRVVVIGDSFVEGGLEYEKSFCVMFSRRIFDSYANSHSCTAKCYRRASQKSGRNEE